MSLGVHDFKEIIEKNYYYVDKTMFIYELLKLSGDKVTIIPRPRRFGKTLNMTMLKYFFEKHPVQPNHRYLFDGLAVSKYPEIMNLQGKFPVIFITFKGIKDSTWSGCYKKIIGIIIDEYKNHKYVLEHEALDEFEKNCFTSIISQKADQNDYEKALKMLAELLFKVHKQKPIILIDEYDAPMQAGFEFDYYEEIKNFMYSFFCAGLKDNNYLEFSVITGILRVAKESIFSGMNNVATYSMLTDRFADKFGFLEDEVEQIFSYFNVPIKLETVREWYNGYRVGSIQHEDDDESFLRVYNPWSIIECISKKKLGTHWINTGGHFLIQETMRHASAQDKEDLMNILEGKTATKRIDDAIVFRDVYSDSSSMWSFLVFTGYLTWKTRLDMVGETTAELIAPNVEVKSSLRKMIIAWFNNAKMNRAKFDEMVDGIDDGAPKRFLMLFHDNVLASMSFFDIGDDGENVYQAFTLGILVSLADTHEITTNRESGYGRYDLCIIPKDPNKVGMIIEFKRRKLMEKGALSTWAKAAFDQIKINRYDVVMQTRGIKRICKIGIAFQGKQMAWKFEVQEGERVIEKGSYSAERAAKAASKKKKPSRTMGTKKAVTKKTIIKK